MAWGDIDPRLTHGSLGQSESTPKWQIDRFSRFLQVHQTWTVQSY